MTEKWKIISNSSDHLILERGEERMDVPKPDEPAAEELFLKAPFESSSVCDQV